MQSDLITTSPSNSHTTMKWTYEWVKCNRPGRVRLKGGMPQDWFDLEPTPADDGTTTKVLWIKHIVTHSGYIPQVVIGTNRGTFSLSDPFDMNKLSITKIEEV